MKKHSILFCLFALTVLINGFGDDAALVNNFIWPSNNTIPKDEYSSILCEFGTFFTDIADLKPKLSLYCASGMKGGTEVPLGGAVIIIDIPYQLKPGYIGRLNDTFKHDFLENGYIRLDFSGEELTIRAEKTGEYLHDYFEKTVTD